MDLKGKGNNGPKWLIIVSIQTVFMLFVCIWAITQKVEADKQKELAKLETEKAVMEKGNQKKQRRQQK
jgi:hypothetical protein